LENQSSMNNIVSQRFVTIHDALIEQKIVRSSRQFAMSLDYLPQSLSEILKGRRDAPVTVLQKLIQVYHINPNYLFGETEEMFLGNEEKNNGPEFCIVTDQDDVEKIMYVPIAAQAGYSNQHNDLVFCEDLKTFSLPDDRFKYGTHRCFDIAGDSMEPSLFSGDKVVCSLIEPSAWKNSIKDNLVYVIVMQNDVLVKRVINKIKTKGQLELHSDNGYYDMTQLPIAELKEIWCVRVKISPFMPSPGNVRNAFQEQVDQLNETVKMQSNLIKGLNQTIEKMLKQNRVATVV